MVARKQSYSSKLKLYKSMHQRSNHRNASAHRKRAFWQGSINKSVKRKMFYKRKLLSATGIKRRELIDKIRKIENDIARKGRNVRRQKNINKDAFDKKLLSKQMIRKPHKTSLRGSTKDGFFVRNKIYPIIHITPQSIPDIMRIIREKYNDCLIDLRDDLTIDTNTVKHIKLLFSDVYGDFLSSKNVSSLEQVIEALRTEMNRHNTESSNNMKKENKEDEDRPTDKERYIYAVDFFIFNSSTKTGCSTRIKPKYIFNLSSTELIRLYNPKAKDNRCFDMCLIRGRPNCKRRAHRVRQKLNIISNQKIDPKSDEAHKIADELGVSYVAYIGIRKPNRLIGDNIKKSFKLYHQYGVQDKTTIQILMIAGHCYLINDKHIYKIKCDKCGYSLKGGIEKDHKCSSSKLTFYQKHICKNDVLQINKLKRDVDKNWVFFDLETLPCGKGETHCVYAVGWYDVKMKKYFYSYGKNSMDEFMDWISKQNKRKYIAFNGCRFDFYFLQKKLIQQKIIPNFLLNNGRLLALKWDKNDVWDLCNFMPGFSLKNACEAFGTKCQKGDFDHEKMLDWDCVNEYKDEVLPYLKSDVMSLKELTEAYVDTCESDYIASPTKYVTLSSYAENVWKSHIDSDDCIIEVPDMEKQDFIRQSVYGGRTYPCRRHFQSSHYQTIKDNETDTVKCEQIYREMLKSGDYIFNGDINSQYPACMAGCELMGTKYPSGFSKWIIDDADKCKFIFDKGKKLGIYEISFICPNKKLRHPILPRKKYIQRKNGSKSFVGVEWSLTDGIGVYNTVDIQNAIKFGYQIKFLGRALVWKTKSSDIFDTYIHTVYNNKVNATKNKNKVKRAIAKLMMNSLYGKTLQRPMDKTDVLVKRIEDVEKFLVGHVLTDWEIVENEDGIVDHMLLSGDKINPLKIAKKPVHLGSFVLGYSRRLWLKFLEGIDPTIETQITTYLDTDSLHILGKHFKILKQKGMIDNEKLGFLSNDCDNGALIINEVNLSPKCYMYECLDRDGKVYCVMKSKGIMKQYLEQDWFENDEKHQVEWTGMKKINKRITHGDRANGITHWSIKKQKYTRTFNKNTWSGMKFENNYFYPIGYSKE